jgi:hypothetical protein
MHRGCAKRAEPFYHRRVGAINVADNDRFLARSSTSHRFREDRA